MAGSNSVLVVHIRLREWLYNGGCYWSLFKFLLQIRWILLEFIGIYWRYSWYLLENTSILVQFQAELGVNYW